MLSKQNLKKDMQNKNQLQKQTFYYKQQHYCVQASIRLTSCMLALQCGLTVHSTLEDAAGS